MTTKTSLAYLGPMSSPPLPAVPQIVEAMSASKGSKRAAEGGSNGKSASLRFTKPFVGGNKKAAPPALPTEEVPETIPSPTTPSKQSFSFKHFFYTQFSLDYLLLGMLKAQ